MQKKRARNGKKMKEKKERGRNRKNYNKRERK